MVRPATTDISAFCTNLTGITQARADAGVTFEEACGELVRDFGSRSRLWASWGDYDRTQFEKDVAATNERTVARAGERALRLLSPFGPRHMNVKTLFMLAFDLPDEVGMEDALGVAGLTPKGRLHSGVDDAANIAALLGVMLGRLRSAPARPGA